jgi:RIO kinase 1
MSAKNQSAIVEGQFDDAPLQTNVPAVDDQQDPRVGGYFIDDERLVSWSDESSEDDDGDELNEDDFEDVRADDEDWEVAERGELYSSLKRPMSDHPRFYQTI